MQRLMVMVERRLAEVEMLVKRVMERVGVMWKIVGKAVVVVHSILSK